MLRSGKPSNESQGNATRLSIILDEPTFRRPLSHGRVPLEISSELEIPIALRNTRSCVG